MSLNIFSSLARYADRQTENFLTESFVYLLNLLLQREPAVALSVLQKLCGGKSELWFTPLSKISITTQFTTDQGRPDIVITINDTKVVLVEVKHDSPLGWNQMERYINYLQNSQYTEKQLVLLSRSRTSLQETSLPREAFHHICWYEIYDWLSRATIAEEVSKYTVYQFLEFLLTKEMSMEKVTWEYIEGIPAMIRLVNMLRTAISELSPNEKIKPTPGWNWMGYYMGKNSSIFVGFRYNNHLGIRFENDRGYKPTFIRELSLSDAHFFSLSAGEQLECLIKFIKDSQKEYLEQNPNGVALSQEAEIEPFPSET